jgi:hypothetical protein
MNIVYTYFLLHLLPFCRVALFLICRASYKDSKLVAEEGHEGTDLVVAIAGVKGTTITVRMIEALLNSFFVYYLLTWIRYFLFVVVVVFFLFVFSDLPSISRAD